MMKKIQIFFPVVLLSVAIVACSPDDSPQAYEGEEPVVSYKILPQGNHDYDKTILKWYDLYNTIPLYKFSAKDYLWSVTSDERWSYDSESNKTNGGYEIVQANERYVGDLLRLIDNKLLKYYPDTLLKKIIPMKVLLSDSIIYVGSSLTGMTPKEYIKNVNCHSGYDYFAFAGADGKTAGMTSKEKNTYKNDVNEMLLKYAIDNGHITYPAEFGTITDYTLDYTMSTCYQAGLVTYIVPSATYDLYTYVKLITSTNYDVIKSKYLDKYPKIATKYQLVVDFFKKRYNVDLQKIGNDEEK